MSERTIAQGGGLRKHRPPRDPRGAATPQRQGNRQRTPRLVGRYQYGDEDGQLLYQVCRYAPEHVVIRRPTSPGQWSDTLEGVRLVLYRLPELLEANYDEPVFLVEREQDADRLARLGLVATTQAFGLGQWDEAYQAHLADRPIVLLSTTDPASAQHAQLVAGSVIRVADGVKWITLPGIEAGQGVTEWLVAGHTVDELRRLVNETPRLQKAEVIPPPTVDDNPEDPR
jgi:putative DNA primase/helicase